jgi:ATP-dependent RNA helicase HelY
MAAAGGGDPRQQSREQRLARYGFALDDFQLRAIDAIDAGESVLVAAPTGSGKTVVAEYGVARTLEQGKRAFYTAPVKALSNQKYHDLVRLHGPDQVGLLTGDNNINGDAPIVVMTTEVLRNMIYARSTALSQLGLVVLDEVHYLQDAYRGPVWEEVIIHLPPTVRLICLSATVSNAEEVTDWISTVRGLTAAIVETKRPVTLHNLTMIGDRTQDRLHLLPTLVNGNPNADAIRIDNEAARGWKGGKLAGKRKLYTPGRVEVVERLDKEELLPAIYFVFSRNGCDEAAKACLDAGLRLTTAPERERIRAICKARLDSMQDADLSVLGYARFVACLDAGIAAHHAGMVPPFKEVVEACFTEGLVKVVFATETLAVGINMPARTVVIDKLSKFTGEHHAMLTPGEYTQLTGRAGRRGIDNVGQAVVLWSPFVPFEQVATLASSKTFHLTSAFRPTYNMAANLVRAYRRDQAEQLLSLSFAQYQADGDVVRIEARLARRRAALAELREDAVSPFGDIDEYLRLTNRKARRDTAVPVAAIEAALAHMRLGDILLLDRGRYKGPVAVLSVASRKNQPSRVRAVTAHGVPVQVVANDFTEIPKSVGKVALPKPYAPNRESFQREAAAALQRTKIPANARDGARPKDEVADHPVLNDPDLPARLKSASAAERVEREIVELETKVGGRSRSLAKAFDRVMEVLTTFGYVEDWQLSRSGQQLARLFNECDLLILEALRRGLLDGVDGPTLAFLVSVFTYEHRSSEPPPPAWFPSNDVRKRWRQIEQLATELSAVELHAGLNPTRRPDPTFGAIAYAWAAGEGFAEVVEQEELSGGDFVRNIKQLVDLLRQIAEIAEHPGTRKAAARARDGLFRGVVAASSAVEVDDPTVVEASAIIPAAS